MLCGKWLFMSKRPMTEIINFHIFEADGRSRLSRHTSRLSLDLQVVLVIASALSFPVTCFMAGNEGMDLSGGQNCLFVVALCIVKRCIQNQLKSYSMGVVCKKIPNHTMVTVKFDMIAWLARRTCLWPECWHGGSTRCKHLGEFFAVAPRWLYVASEVQRCSPQVHLACWFAGKDWISAVCDTSAIYNLFQTCLVFFPVPTPLKNLPRQFATNLRLCKKAWVCLDISSCKRILHSWLGRPSMAVSCHSWLDIITWETKALAFVWYSAGRCCSHWQFKVFKV